MSTAVISPCGQYRYSLYRRIPQALRWVKPCLFLMLNPSIADATVDDPTIRRCLGFAKGWGCTSLTVVNLFALRSTDPAALAGHADPVGPLNDWHIQYQVEQHAMGIRIAAWGAHPMAEKRARSIAGLEECFGALKLTKAGWPSHPLYLKGDCQPMDWTMP